MLPTHSGIPKKHSLRKDEILSNLNEIRQAQIRMPWFHSFVKSERDDLIQVKTRMLVPTGVEQCERMRFNRC